MNYARNLSGIRGVGSQPKADWADSAPWLYCITVDEEAFGISRDELADRLRAQGIDTRPFFIPLHHLPPFCDASRARGEALPVTDHVAASGLNLPTYAGLKLTDIKRITDALRNAKA